MKNEKLKQFFSSKTAKSIAIFTMVILIGVAVYVNYKLFYDPTASMGFGENNMQNGTDGSQATGTDAENDYFTATALDRQQARDEAIDVLKLVTESDDASEAAKAEASAKISQIAVDIQNEANIETLVKAKGFEECVAIISEDAVSVIVSADELLANQTAQILTIVYETTGISPDKVSIINRV